MDFPFPTQMTTGFPTDETGSGSGFTDDYDPVDPGMCEKSWVRGFRGTYEPPLFWLIFVLGAVGNLTVVCIYTTVRSRLKTMTDVYLLNLAVADLLFLCTLPFWASDATRGWDFSVGLCKMVSAFYKINLFSSMLLLTCISVDRYISIVQVTKARNLRKKTLFYSKLACLAVWLASLLLALPEFIFAQVKSDLRGRSFCALVYLNDIHNRTKIIVLSLQICVGFCLPLLIMVFCYSVIIRTLMQANNFERHKALRVIFAVVAVFLLSQLPYNSLLVIEATQASNITITSCATATNVDVAGQVAKSLAYTHACLNPFLYVFVGVRFRKDLLKMLSMFAGVLHKGSLDKVKAEAKRPSVMSDTEMTPALSL